MEKPFVPKLETTEEQPPEKRFWEGPYPTVQALLKREKDLKSIKSRDDQEVQMEIDRRNELVEKIEKMAEPPVFFKLLKPH